jgi:hypothetical protein
MRRGKGVFVLLNQALLNQALPNQVLLNQDIQVFVMLSFVERNPLPLRCALVGLRGSSHQ